jgi:hypothetical protein
MFVNFTLYAAASLLLLSALVLWSSFQALEGQDAHALFQRAESPGAQPAVIQPLNTQGEV